MTCDDLVPSAEDLMTATASTEPMVPTIALTSTEETATLHAGKAMLISRELLLRSQTLHADLT